MIMTYPMVEQSTSSEIIVGAELNFTSAIMSSMIDKWLFSHLAAFIPKW